MGSLPHLQRTPGSRGSRQGAEQPGWVTREMCEVPTPAKRSPHRPGAQRALEHTFKQLEGGEVGQALGIALGALTGQRSCCIWRRLLNDCLSQRTVTTT